MRAVGDCVRAFRLNQFLIRLNCIIWARRKARVTVAFIETVTTDSIVCFCSQSFCHRYCIDFDLLPSIQFLTHTHTHRVYRTPTVILYYSNGLRISRGDSTFGWMRNFGSNRIHSIRLNIQRANAKKIAFASNMLTEHCCSLDLHTRNCQSKNFS